MTKSVRKFTQNQVGREDMGSGQELCPWEGDSEEKILHRWRPSLGKELFRSHTEHPALESDTGKMSPLCWLQG